MKKFNICCLFLCLACGSACKNHKTDGNGLASQNASEVTQADDNKKIKAGAVVTIESYYVKNRLKFLVLAEAKTNEEFEAAFDAVLKMHVRNDIPNFKLSCPYFYQFHEIKAGINNQFQDPAKAWVKQMAQDLRLIIANLLRLPSDETVDLVIKIFACRFDRESLEEHISLEAAKKILIDLDEQIRQALSD